ncbi:hypothetical protein Q7P35_011006 [Cladosporium inversicolor]
MLPIRSMPYHSRVLSKDEELGKRDDDFRPKRSHSAANVFNVLRWRKRRLFGLLAGIVLLYFFIANPPADLRRVDGQRYSQPAGLGQYDGASTTPLTRKEPTGAPPRPITDEEDSEVEKQYYDGPIKFYRLASSLHSITRTMGQRNTNRNVLFAASSLKSVANLIPMACEMAKWDRNYVHLALLGRDALSLDEILEINGVSSKNCAVLFHDGRGDYSEYSTDRRFEVSVSGAMRHINEFMHPQAIITDDSLVEDAPFTRAMRAKGKEYDHPVIEIPEDAYEDFLWMTRLDSGSLSCWHKPQIDILIHAPRDSSGGLIRLLKSLESADYAGLRPPRLTIELPSSIEPSTGSYLSRFHWPPAEHWSPTSVSTLSARHRLPDQHASSEQSSLRFLESFFPTSPDTHVLLLSPQAELSPQYLQYLQYVILEYRYSSYGSPYSGELVGASLDVPSMLLNGSGPLPLPKVADMKGRTYLEDEKLDKSAPSPFIYQAPSSIASLIFGEKWATFHSFVANRLAASQTGKAKKLKKEITETEPAWMEYLLELMRARNWHMFHPAKSFVTVHNELAQIPEEFVRPEKGQKDDGTAKQSHSTEGESFLSADEPPVIVPHTERKYVSGHQALHSTLPFKGDLPELPHLPLLNYRGEQSSFTETNDVQRKYIAYFREHVGGCDAKEAKRKRLPHGQGIGTDDLFCLPGKEPDYDGEDEDEEVALAIAKASDPQPSAG